MRTAKSLVLPALVWTILGVGIATTVAAQTYEELHQFGNGKDGQIPFGALVLDAQGNLYGTTMNGGEYGFGTVYELSPKAGGGWTETVIHDFGSSSDGKAPSSALAIDGHGNLYGTTENGGTNGAGAVFEMSPSGDGSWTEQVLHSFAVNPRDGYNPYGSVALDAAGNIYGTTSYGGANNLGAVFELRPTSSGAWIEKILHSFGGTDGRIPFAGVTIENGRLYGTTQTGGVADLGTVFELRPISGGVWEESVLHSFGADTSDGQTPKAGVIFDAKGNFYGTTVDGGINGYGTVYELSPTSAGWRETILHSFESNGADGTNPWSNVVFDKAGNLYGTTEGGGLDNWGTVYELTPQTGAAWLEKSLHSFKTNGRDGFTPAAGVIFDSAGHLYGATNYGGGFSEGLAFELTP